jgi:hypothetical protein
LLKENDFYKLVKETPILTKDQLFSRKIGNVWSKMQYPTSIENFMSASDRELENMMDEMYDYPVLYIPNSERRRFEEALERRHDSRQTPQEVIVDIMERIMNLESEDEDDVKTRIAAMEVALNNNISERNRRRRVE